MTYIVNELQLTYDKDSFPSLLNWGSQLLLYYANFDFLFDYKQLTTYVKVSF